MICPLDASGWRSWLGGSPQAVPSRGSGADDETTGCLAESDGEKDHVVGRGRDHRSERADDEALAGAVGEAWLLGVGRSAEGPTECEAGAAGDGGDRAAALPGELLRFQHPALSREAASRARDRTELHLGAKGIARSGSGNAAEPTKQTPAPAGEAAAAGDDATH